MGLTEKHLADGEVIQLRLRTHWKALVLPTLLLVVLIAIVVGTAALTRGTDWGTWAFGVVAVIAVVLALVGFAIPIWRWASSVYVFTNRRVSYRHGLLTKKGRDIPLYRINDVAIEKGPIDRVLGCGNLIVSDATDKAGMELSDVPGVETVQVTLQNLLFQHDDGSDDGEHPPTEPPRPRGG